MYSKYLAVLAVTVASGATIGCEDPAQGKPKATVASAQPVSSGAATKGATSATYKVDAAKSTFVFVGAKVTGTQPGGFKTFTGSATIDTGKVEASSVEIDIDMKSVFSSDPKLTGHLKNKDFFDVDGHPKARFRSTKVAKGGSGEATHTITGNLTLRGATKSITFPAKVTVSGAVASVKAEFSINRKDFKIEYAGMADDLIKDDVLIKLDLKLNKG